jgi:hypothetical protein
LVRIAQAPTPHALKAAAAAEAAGMAPPKKTFGFGSTYNPNKYTRRSTDPAGTAGGEA